MACYDFEYAMQMLCQSIDFAETEHDFVPLRKWANEVEQSGHEMGATDPRLNLPAGQLFMTAILQSVASGSLSPDEALWRIRFWFDSGQTQEVDVELPRQFELA